MNKRRLKFKREEDYVVYQNNEKERNRVNSKVKWDIFTSEGLCGQCGKECSINPKTNKLFKECDFHKKQTKKRNHNYWLNVKKFKSKLYPHMVELADTSDLKPAD